MIGQLTKQWLAELLKYGLLKASFVPPAGQRELRELTRYRTTFVRERATLVNRVHKALESTNIKLTSVATDVMGVSGRAILAELIQGQARAEVLADLAKGRLRAKRDDLIKALEGHAKPHHRFVLTELLCEIDNLDEAIARFDQQIQEYGPPFAKAIQHLDTIPGVARDIVEVIVAEIGVNMSHFPSDAHLAALGGVAPGNHDSAGKRASGKLRPGNKALRTALNQAAHAAARTKNTSLAVRYQRLAARRGKKKAIMAVAHSILVIAYHLIQRHEDYRELGGDYFENRRPETTAQHLIKRLEGLSYTVTVRPTGRHRRVINFQIRFFHENHTAFSHRMHTGSNIQQTKFSYNNANCHPSAWRDLGYNGIADLVRHGLLWVSFIPPVAQRELRVLTRFRSTVIRERAALGGSARWN